MGPRSTAFQVGLKRLIAWRRDVRRFSVRPAPSPPDLHAEEVVAAVFADGVIGGGIVFSAQLVFGAESLRAFRPLIGARQRNPDHFDRAQSQRRSQ
jgi:hypothetical protein